MPQHVVIIGAGPAGLMAAEHLSSAGLRVSIFDRMPSPARKFLMAGRGGLNLTHSEVLPKFMPRYREASDFLSPMIAAFTPDDLRAWCEHLGQETFVGTSGRIFPKSMKASPLLRSWLQRLKDQGVEFFYGTTWRGWDGTALLFSKTSGEDIKIEADAVLLALGGASWPRLGSDGAWAEILAEKNVKIRKLRPANCGFAVAWSPVFREKFAGQPVKPVILSGGSEAVQGEIMITRSGIEGGAVYALSSLIRDEVDHKGKCIVHLDLRPDIDAETLRQRLSKPKGRDTLANHLRKAGGLSPVAIGLVQEILHQKKGMDPVFLVKKLPLVVTATADIDRAISSAGGIKLDQVNENLMLRQMPGVFVAGEMLDWEAPTGGYLLQACFSTAVQASKGILSFLGADSRT